MIGSHNIPPPPAKDGDRASIAAVIGEPETPLDAPPLGKEGEELGDKGIDIEDVDKLAGVGGNPDIILENSTGSIPAGTGEPAAAAAATISAGVGS